MINVVRPQETCRPARPNRFLACARSFASPPCAIQHGLAGTGPPELSFLLHPVFRCRQIASGSPTRKGSIGVFDIPPCPTDQPLDVHSFGRAGPDGAETTD